MAANVRLWRTRRGLDQQALADRLADLGWSVDRTTITRIERGDRKVTVDDLGLIAVALSMPITVLLLPIDHEGVANVVLTPKGRTAAVNRWLLWEWLLGNDPLPERFGDEHGAEWRGAAEPLWLYERVRAAQLALNRLERDGAVDGQAYIEALQELVDAVADMEQAGYPAGDLIAPAWATAIKSRRIEPSPRPRRVRIIRTEESQ